MFQGNNVVAIDIGSKNIKLVQGRLTGRGASVTSFGMCVTPKNSFVNGKIVDKRDIIKAVSDLLTKCRVRARNVIFGIKGQDIITRHIGMPSIPDKQLKQAVMLDIKQYLPMDPNEYVIDSKRTGRVDAKDSKLNDVLLVAAPKEKINDYFFIADKLGLKIHAVDLFVNSTSRLFQQDVSLKNPGNVKKCIAYVDIGYESSIVILVEDGKLFFEREIGIGVKDIDVMLKNAYASSEEEIDSIRKNIISLGTNPSISGNEDPRSYYANTKAKEILDTISDNLIKVFDFYTSGGFGRSISNIYIGGGGSMLRGIADYIGTSLNTGTRVFDAEMLKNVYNIDEDLKNNQGLYLNCISLLLRKD